MQHEADLRAGGRRAAGRATCGCRTLQTLAGAARGSGYRAAIVELLVGSELVLSLSPSPSLLPPPPLLSRSQVPSSVSLGLVSC